MVFITENCVSCEGLSRHQTVMGQHQDKIPALVSVCFVT